MKAVRSLLATYSDECHRARGSRAEMSNKPSNQSFPRKIRAGERFAGVSRALGFGNDERVNAEAKGPLGHERSQGAGGPRASGFPRLGHSPGSPLRPLRTDAGGNRHRQVTASLDPALFPSPASVDTEAGRQLCPRWRHTARGGVCVLRQAGTRVLGGTIGAAPGPLGSVNTNSHSAISGFKDPPGPLFKIPKAIITQSGDDGYLFARRLFGNRFSVPRDKLPKRFLPLPASCLFGRLN